MKTRLDSLKVLVFDCQASHPDPQKGHLLEAAWGILDKYQEKAPFFSFSAATLVKPESDIDLPRQVSRVTGISLEDLDSGQSIEAVWEQLLTTSHQVSEAQELKSCPTVIHYSRYEAPFLNYLKEVFSPNDSFHFDIICTHKIAQRLWPDLPRKGLRALAGFLGYSVEEFRRSTHHICATAWIWRKTVRILLDEHGIETIEDLKSWLDKKKTSTTGQRIYPMGQEKRQGLPQKPGVYRMYRSNGDILYIGKATSLRQRVNSYFQRKSAHAEHKLEMLSQAVDLSVTKTPSALEAAVLESDEIKKHSPPYNIALKTGTRQMVYASPDLDSFSPKLSSAHIRGPYPSSNPLKSFSILAKLFFAKSSNQIDEITRESLLNIPSDFLPELECLWEGIDFFKEKFQGALGKQVTISDLLKLAHTLHQEKLDLLVEEDDSADVEELDEFEDDAAEQDEDIEFEWTPETLCHHLEGVLRFGAHLIRRTKWFYELSESILMWSHKKEKKAKYHRVIIINGSIFDSSETPGYRTIPVPQNAHVPHHRRKQYLDLATYDRLRVITTEIRRLVSENREVFLRLGENRLLGSESLRRKLRWL